MELSPQSVASTSFKTVKKGYDPEAVRAYLATLSKSIESLQSQATAMEARARAAVARLQEIAGSPNRSTTTGSVDEREPGASSAQQPVAPVRSTMVAPVEESETISRTLLLAQRTADLTVAEAKAEAENTTKRAHDDAQTLVAAANASADALVKDAVQEARRAGDLEKVAVENEVHSLLARREFLVSDVEHLEIHIVNQRERVRDVAGALTDIVNRAPGGLADIRRPLMSAVGPETGVSSGAATADSAAGDEGVVNGGSEDHEPADPASSNQGLVDAESVDAESVDAESVDGDSVVSEVDGSDSTPPSGVPGELFFEDVTAEVARPVDVPAES